MISSIFALSLGLIAASSSFDSGFVQGKSKNSEVRLISQFESLSPNTHEVLLGLDFRLSRGWHAYWKNPGDVGYSPKLKWSLPKGLTVSELYYPAPKRFPAPSEGIAATSFGYERRATYFAVLQIDSDQFKAKTLPIDLSVDYLVCEEICVPEKAKLQLEIPVTTETPSPLASRINTAFQLLPTELLSLQVTRKTDLEIEFDFLDKPITDVFLYSPHKKGEFFTASKIENTNRWKLSLEKEVAELEYLATYDGPEGLSGYSGKVPESASNFLLSEFLLALLFAFIGGAILNLMPCVLPVVFMKMTSLLKLRESGGAVRPSALLTIAGVLFSFCILAVALLVAQSLGHQVGWGFQFQSPAFVSFMLIAIFLFALNLFGLFEIQLPGRFSTGMASKSGAFFEGVFATALATPCSAPFLGTALAFAIGKSAPVLFLFFIAMGLGLSLPYLLFLIHPKLVNLLPKPGMWMAKLKTMLGYSLLAAVLWLFYVLNQQSSSLFSLILISTLVLIFLIIREFRFKARWAAVFVLSLFVVASAESFNAAQSEMTAHHFEFSESALGKKIDEHEVVFLNITADWCLTCKYNEATVLRTQAFEELLGEKNVEFLLVDWTNRNEAIGAYLEKNNRAGIPFAAILSKDKVKLLPELLTIGIVEEALEEF